MAGADYRYCDNCDTKAFYDSNLNYEVDMPRSPIPKDQLVRDTHYKIDSLGDWKVLCRECAKTHKCIIVPIDYATQSAKEQS